MSIISFKQKGDFSKTNKFLKKASNLDYSSILNRYGQAGVSALASATPVDTGLTASSWSYEITKSNGKYKITWTNSNIVNGVSIAIILQYGHGTRNGGYVQGRDYINPALQPTFDLLAEAAWREVTNA